MRNAFLSIFIQPFQTLPLPPTNYFFNKTVIITGANAGIGLEVARHVLPRGALKVILAVRNLNKGEAAKEDLLKTPGIYPETIEIWELDQASFSSVKAFAERANKLDRIDYVFLNAGMATPKYVETEDGFETTVQVNGLSTALLALLLLPYLIAQSRTGSGAERNIPRLVITSSGLHNHTPFTERHADNILEKLNSKDNFVARIKAAPHDIYATTKLLNMYTVQRLVPLIPSHPQTGNPLVIVTGVDPGFCRSEINKGIPFPMNIVRAVFGRTTEEGSRNLVAAAMKDKTGNGGYVADAVLTPAGHYAITEEGSRAGDKVWGEMLEVLKRVAPEIVGVLNSK